MSSLTKSQQTNLLSQVFVTNEAPASQWFRLNNAGMQNWRSTDVVTDVLKNRSSGLTGNSGMTVSLVQLDFAGNRYARDLATALTNQAFATGSLTEGDAKQLKADLLGFHARNLAGYADYLAYRDGNYSQSVADMAYARLDRITANTTLLENLMTNDPVGRAAYDKAVLAQLGECVDNGRSAVGRINQFLAGADKSSALIGANEDKMVVALGDYYNQKGNTAAIEGWIKANPDATWAEFVAFNATARPDGGARRATEVGALFDKVADGRASPNTPAWGPANLPQPPAGADRDSYPSPGTVTHHADGSNTYEYEAKADSADGSIKQGDLVSQSYDKNGAFGDITIWHKDGSVDQRSRSEDGKQDTWSQWNQDGKLQNQLITEVDNPQVVVGGFTLNGQKYNGDGIPVADPASSTPPPPAIDPASLPTPTITPPTEADAQNVTQADFANTSYGLDNGNVSALPANMLGFAPTGNIDQIIADLWACGYEVEQNDTALIAQKGDEFLIVSDGTVEMGMGARYSRIDLNNESLSVIDTDHVGMTAFYNNEATPLGQLHTQQQTPATVFTPTADSAAATLNFSQETFGDEREYGLYAHEIRSFVGLETPLPGAMDNLALDDSLVTNWLETLDSLAGPQTGLTDLSGYDNGWNSLIATTDTPADPTTLNGWDWTTDSGWNFNATGSTVWDAGDSLIDASTAYSGYDYYESYDYSYSFYDYTYDDYGPVVLDLDGDGIELIAKQTSQAWYDLDGSGARFHTGWVGADDGLLAIDDNGDGQISAGREIAFSLWTPDNATDTDMEALATTKVGYESGGNLLAGFATYQYKDTDGQLKTRTTGDVSFGFEGDSYNTAVENGYLRVSQSRTLSYAVGTSGALNLDLAQMSLDGALGSDTNDTFKSSGSARVILTGNGGNDLLTGDDRLFGAGGDDTLDGGLGADRMNGGLGGNDRLDGGAGAAPVFGEAKNDMEWRIAA